MTRHGSRCTATEAPGCRIDLFRIKAPRERGAPHALRVTLRAAWGPSSGARSAWLLYDEQRDAKTLIDARRAGDHDAPDGRRFVNDVTRGEGARPGADLDRGVLGQR